MKRFFTLLLGFFLVGMPLMSQEDSVTSLIFTEFYGRDPYSAYYELTNMGDTALDLSSFWLGIVPAWAPESCFDWTEDIPKIIPNGTNWGKRLPAIKIQPGQSMLINNVFDSPGGDDDELDWRRWTWNHSEFLNSEIYFPIHANESGEPEFWDRPDLEMFGFDSIDVEYEWMCYLWNGTGATALFYVYPDGTDSVLVDQVRLAKNPNGNNLNTSPSDVAGVTDASYNSILVRKASVKKGNTDWDLARGIDLMDSEWIPISPYSKLNRYDRSTPYTTVGTHGDFSISLSSNTITIDEENSTLTVPWGILKHDSILDEFVLGSGMAWIYYEDTNDFADSAYSTVQEGDVIRFMACGNDYEEKEYTIIVDDPGTDAAEVFPKRRMRYEAIDDEDFNGQYWAGTPYYVTEDAPVIDSIGDVPFGTRIDTMLKYLEKAPNASWDIEWVDGLERVDLKDGDKLVVTAEDGSTTKEYYICVNLLEKDENALLGAITWPDKPYYMDGWVGDTIPNFSPNSTIYQVTLPYGTENVPSFTALPQDINAKISVERATSLSGSQAERTTTFTVSSENDSLTNIYSVLFSVEQRPEDIQYFTAEPFISEVTGSKRHYFELVNVGDVPLDMSKYLFAWTSTGATPAEAITSIGASTGLYEFTTRYRYGYVPGYKFSDDTIEWQSNPAKLYFDSKVNPVVDPGDVFVIGNPIKTKWVKANAVANSDVITNCGRDWIAQLDTNYNTWGVENLIQDLQMGMHWNALYLFRIDNDTILNGDKPLNADPNDFTLIDMVGDPGISRWQDMWVGEHQRLDWNNHLSMRRKSSVYAGNPDADSTSNRDNWVSTSQNDADFSGDVYQWIGSHTFDPVTAHKSTITSLVYLVSVGYQDLQSIQGDLTAVSVETFFGNISKADEGQVLTVLDGTDGSEKDLASTISDNDTLKVVSANGKNITKYLIISQALDDNAVITAEENSGIVIEITDENGVIKGVDYGTNLKDAMDNLIIPSLANATIVDQNDEPIPYKKLNYDTIMVNSLIGNNTYIEVIAQNGINKILYKFEPTSESSDAYVISTLFSVDQNNNTISEIPGGINTMIFWKNIEVVFGATATLVDKAGFTREEGNLSFDDKLEVVSEDQSVTRVYYLNFLTEEDPDGNMAPEVSLNVTETTLEDEMEIDLSATVSDDGFPFGAELSYNWSVLEGEESNVSFSDANALSTKATFSETGDYKLAFTANDSEKNTTAEVLIHVKSADGINSFNLQTRIYPNPASDKLNIEIESVTGAQAILKIHSMTGKVVYMENLNAEKTTVDVSSFQSGIYFISIENGENVITHKLNIVK